MVGFNADMITRALFVNAQAVRVASPRFFIDGNVMTELLPAQSSSAPRPPFLPRPHGGIFKIFFFFVTCLVSVTLSVASLANRSSLSRAVLLRATRASASYGVVTFLPFQVAFSVLRNLASASVRTFEWLAMVRSLPGAATEKNCPRLGVVFSSSGRAAATIPACAVELHLKFAAVIRMEGPDARGACPHAAA